VVLSRASLAEMWRRVVPMSQGYGAAGDSYMGLSFFLIGPADAPVIGHTGSQAGFRAFMFFNPRTRTAVIAAFNTTNQAAPASRAARLQALAIALLR
jgi:CubicO group peptidase (beta-lactamase class C family)